MSGPPVNTFTEVAGELDVDPTEWDGGATTWDIQNEFETIWDADTLGWSEVP